MFEKLVSDLLEKYLGEYVEGLNANDLKIGIWGGDVKLNNIRIKPSALDALDLPIAMTIGSIGNITLKIPWKRLKEDPVVVVVEDIYVLAEPRTSFDTDPAKAAKAAKDAKKAKLDAYEKLKAERAASKKNGGAEADPGYMAQLVTKIVDNLQLTVRRVHVRYEDRVSRPDHPVALGLTVDEISAVSTDEDFQQTFLNDPLAALVHKLVRIGNFSVYMDHPKSLYSRMEAQDALVAFKKDIPLEFRENCEHDYLIRPFTQEAKIIINKKQDDLSIPTHRVALDITSWEVSLTKTQYVSLMKVLETFNMLSLRVGHLDLRPRKPVKGNAALWWQYAINVHLKRIRAKNSNSIGKTLITRGIARRRYVQLYKRTTGVAWVEKLKADEKKELEALEDQHTANDIIFFRSTADAQLEAEAEEYAKTQKSKSWLGGWFNWTSKDDKKKDESLLSQEQVNAVYDVIDYNAAIDPSTLPPDFVKTQVSLSIARQALTVCNDQLEDPFSLVAAASDINITIALAGKGASVSLSIDDVTVQDSVLAHSEFPYVLSRSLFLLDTEEDESFFDAVEDHPELLKSPTGSRRGSIAGQIRPPVLEVTFEQAPDHVKADAALTLKQQSQEIVVTMPTIQRLGELFTVPVEDGVNIDAVSAAASDSIWQTYTMGTRQFQEALRDHKTLSLDVDIAAPTIVLPEDPFSRDTLLIGLDLGRFTAYTELQTESGNFNQSSQQTLGVKPPEWLDDNAHVYDRFLIGLRACTMFVARHNVGWRVPEMRSVLGMQLLENFDVSIIVCSSITPLEAAYPRVKAAGATSPLKINFNAELYLNAMQVVQSLSPPPPPGQEPTVTAPAVEAAPVPLSNLNELNVDEGEAVVIPTALAAEPVVNENPLAVKERDDNRMALLNWIQVHAFFVIPSFSVTVSAPDPQGSPGSKRRLIVLSMENFGVNFRQRWFDMKADVTLSTLMIEDCLQKQGGSSQYLLSSRPHAGCSDDLIRVTYEAVDRKSPQFENVLSTVDLKFGYLSVTVNQRTIASLLEFVKSITPQQDSQATTVPTQNTAATVSATTPATAIEPAKSEKKPGDPKVLSMKVTASFQQFTIHLLLSGRCISTLALQALSADLEMFEIEAMSVKASLQQLQVFDYTTDSLVKNPYATILSFVTEPGESALELEYDTFNAQRPSSNLAGGKDAGKDAGNVSYDTAVSAKMGQLAVVFRYQFVDELQQYFLNGPLMRALNAMSSPPPSDTPDLYQTPSQITQEDPYQFDDQATPPSCMRIYANIKGPTIIVPTSFTSGEAVVVNIGTHLEVSNAIQQDHISGSLIDHMSVSIIGLDISVREGVAINVAENDHGDIHDVLSLFTGSQRPRSLSTSMLDGQQEPDDGKVLLSDYDIQVNLQRDLTPWIGSAPLTKITVSSNPLRLGVTTALLRSLMSIPNGNLAEQSVLVAEADNWYVTTTKGPQAEDVAVVPQWQSNRTSLLLAAEIPMITVELGMDADHALIDVQIEEIHAMVQQGVAGSQVINGSLATISVIDQSETSHSKYATIVGRQSNMYGLDSDSDEIVFLYETLRTGDTKIRLTLNDMCVFAVAPVVQQLQAFAAEAFPPVPAATEPDPVSPGPDDSALVHADAVQTLDIEVTNIVAYVIADATSDDTRLLRAAINTSVNGLSSKESTEYSVNVRALEVKMAHSSDLEHGSRVLALPQVNATYRTLPQEGKDDVVKIMVDSKPLDVIVSFAFLDLVTELQTAFVPPAPEAEAIKAPAATVTTVGEGKTSADVSADDTAVPHMPLPGKDGTTVGEPEEQRRAHLTSTISTFLAAIASELKVSFKHISLLVADDLEGFTQPIIDLSLGSLIIYARDWQDTENAQGSVSFVLQADHFDKEKSAWVPLIEKWRFGAMLRPDPFTVSIEARDTLHFNLTHAVFSSLNDISLSMAKLGTPAIKGKKSPAPYAIVNKTGMPIKFWVYGVDNPDETETASGTPLDSGDEAPIEGHGGENLVGARQTDDVLVGIQVGDTNPFSGMSLSKVDTRNFKRKIMGQMLQITCQVELRGNVKVLTVRSPYVVLNSTQSRIELSVVLASGITDKVGVVAPTETLPIPVLSVIGTSLILRPVSGKDDDESQYRRSMAYPVVKSGDEDTAPNMNLVCDAVVEGGTAWNFCALRKHTITHPAGYMLATINAVTQKEPWHLELEGVIWDYSETIEIRPRICIENLLPVEMEVSILPLGKDFKWTGGEALKENSGQHIMPGRSMDVHVLDVTSMPGIAVTLPGHKQTEVYHWNRKNSGVMFFQNKNGAGELVLSVNHSVKGDISHQLSIYASYWLIDKTGLGLRYRQKAFLTKGNVAQTAVAEDADHEHDHAHDDSASPEGHVDHDASHKHITPTLLSAPAKKMGMFKSKLEVSADGKSWSKAFGIDSIGVTGVLEFGKGCNGKLFKQTSSASSNVGLELAATISSASGKYSSTRVITIQPRYLFINNTGVAIRVSQVRKGKDVAASSADAGFVIERHETDPMQFHWEDIKGEKTVVFSMDEAKDYSASGAIGLDQPTVSILRLHRCSASVEDRYQLLKVTIVVESSTSFITVTKAEPEDLGYRVINELAIPVHVQQAKGEHKEVVDAGVTYPFGWDKPEDDHDIIVHFGDTDKKQKVSFDKITKGFKTVNVPQIGVVYYYTHVAKTGVRHLVLSPSPDSFLLGVISDTVDLANKNNYHISVKIVGFGISLVNDTPLELLYIYLGGISVQLAGSPKSDALQVSINKFQIDNQMINANFPVLLRHVGDKPFLQATVIKSNRAETIDYFDYANILLQTMELMVDEASILTVAKFFGSLPQAAAVPGESDYLFEAGIVPPAAYDQDKKMYFRHLMINPIELKLSFEKALKSEDDTSQTSTNLNPLVVFAKLLLATVANIDEAPIELNSLILEHPFAPRSELIGRLTTHYATQAVQEAYVILGSFDMLGNPVGLVHNMGTGVMDFFFEPAKGIMLGPKEFGEGLSKGTKSLIKNSVSGVLNTASKITSTVGRGLAVLSLDEKYQNRRKAKVRNTGEGLKQGATELGRGVVEGVTGIVLDPIRGAKEGGAKGLATGVAKGVAGLAVKPIAGLFGFISSAAAGVKAGVTDQVPLQRIRLPRYFDDDGVLLEYSEKEAFGHNLLRIIATTADNSRKDYPDLHIEAYIHHVILGTTALVLTATKVIYFDVKGEDVEWIKAADDIDEVHLYLNAIVFVLPRPAEDPSKKKKKKKKVEPPPMLIVQSSAGMPPMAETVLLQAKLGALGIRTQSIQAAFQSGKKKKK